MLLLAVTAVHQPTLPVAIHSVGTAGNPGTPLTLKKVFK
jgi:hypothetical protein